MPDNVYKFRQAKWADLKRFKMLAYFKSKRSSSRYFSFSCLVILCLLVSFVAVQAWPKVKPEISKSAGIPASSSVRVIDGDTISLEDGKRNVRLVGFNAPETGSRARCEAERQKGEAARQRLRELVSNGRSDFEQVACSCAPGTEGTEACNFGRRCGTLRVNGVDVGSTLINEGLAVRFVCGATSCPTLLRPWC
ncbi:thermonuclease family protein [Bradyrhizobium sp. sBnM-33]|uniref:thermonuclease family protein n=1 Tax=Bradyrhizobium sp. sBnM-33 TaxID=2831780 RepID=UPI001BCEA851|nr:thermonuclease family protein [Bradyrhizobium sp. sBnM-33]WOH48189.1 thermonuclease family protein [Bradyrhizobium sp. sBnM-33]